MRRHGGEGLLFASSVVFTALVHVSLVAILLISGDQDEAEAAVEPELMVFEEVELLKWGEVMPDPNELPTISNPAEETREQDVVHLNQDEAISEPQQDEDPEARPEEEEPEEEQRQDNSRHNQHRPTNNEPIQGSPDGYQGGTSLSATAMANLFGPVQLQIQRAVRPPASLSQAQLEEMEGIVTIYVTREGRIRRYVWRTRTGNAAYDGTIERALERFRVGSERLRLPTHNEAAMNQAVEHGFRITVRGHR